MEERRYIYVYCGLDAGIITKSFSFFIIIMCCLDWRWNCRMSLQTSQRRQPATTRMRMRKYVLIILYVYVNMLNILHYKHYTFCNRELILKFFASLLIILILKYYILFSRDDWKRIQVGNCKPTCWHRVVNPIIGVRMRNYTATQCTRGKQKGRCVCWSGTYNVSNKSIIFIM